MDRVGILIVSKCLSAAAMVDTFSRSTKYRPDFYIVERQVNPFNLRRAKKHIVLPDLDARKVAQLVSGLKKQIAFGLTDTEDFITAGGRDILEEEAGVQMVCVARRYAVERSKADQRILFGEVFPEANPRFEVLDPRRDDETSAIAKLKRFAQDVGEPVIKPDAPARGAGVGVWGSEFADEKEMTSFFLSVFSKGRVVVEERIEGEESSFHAFSDGRHFIPSPATRDYKRALDGNRGRLTGGMGSYRGADYPLPFLQDSEWEHLVQAEERAFRRWKGRGSNPGLRGIVLYDAVMHTANGFKILERNSRGGNTEQINLLTTMEDDFVDVCFGIVEGSLKGIRFRKRASVVTCAVPVAYGRPDAAERASEKIGFDDAYKEVARRKGNLRILPMDVELQGSITRMGRSRSVAAVGIGATTEQARILSLLGVKKLKGTMRSRTDIASLADIRRSRQHLISLRSAG